MRTQLDPEQQFVGHTNIYVAEVVSGFDIGLIKSVVQCEQKRYNSMARRNVVVTPIEGTRPRHVYDTRVVHLLCLLTSA